MRGLELANGYREEFRPEKARVLWGRYNEIRSLRGVPVHAVDDALVDCLPKMQGVSGIAVGLERVLAALVPGLDLRSFV